MNRRGFLGSILALGAAPAIVRASHIMPVRVLEEPLIGVDWWAAGILHGPGCSCLSCIVTNTLRNRARTLAANVTRNNMLLAMFTQFEVQPGSQLALPLAYSDCELDYEDYDD